MANLRYYHMIHVHFLVVGYFQKYALRTGVTRSPSRFSAVSHLGVSVSGVSMTQKRLDGKFWYFGPKTSKEHTTKWAPLGSLKPSIPRPTRRARAHIPIEQPTTVTLSV
jgi:hypothetical protein